ARAVDEGAGRPGLPPPPPTRRPRPGAAALPRLPRPADPRRRRAVAAGGGQPGGGRAGVPRPLPRPVDGLAPAPVGGLLLRRHLSRNPPGGLPVLLAAAAQGAI